MKGQRNWRKIIRMRLVNKIKRARVIAEIWQVLLTVGTVVKESWRKIQLDAVKILRSYLEIKREIGRI